MAASDPRLVLASGSPRRRELLAALGLAFAVRPVELDETPLAGELPGAYVLRLARAKAAAAAEAGEVVLAADTTVVLDAAILGKPSGPDAAEAMLRRLAGREHWVLTAVAVLDADSRREVSAVETSRVRIAPLSAAQIRWYVGTGEPLDKAGSYAIQGLGALLVDEVHGNYTNVVGLPLPATSRLFAELGYDLLAFRDGASGAGAPSPRT
jgi:septum formation protein